ncbi:hypothetical protein DL771_004093 [Monosporascus sp. 5C6A]|nr:hypothetical protein DL771_004093 [Monosporascus sp. 5C6A]
MRYPGARLSHVDYKIGWVCALPVELAAAEALLDETHDALPSDASDTNTYTFGRIHQHNIVIACLPRGRYGTNNAANVAAHMHRSFPCLRVQLMVGIGGGVPMNGDLRLGDVVIGETVVQHDLGKIVRDGRFEPVGRPYEPPRELMTAVTNMEAKLERNPSQLHTALAEMLRRHPHMTAYANSSRLQDCLYDSSYDHVGSNNTCDGCDSSKRLIRPCRIDGSPRIHYGAIASGNQVIKDAQTRDLLAQRLNILCVEMEAAGLMHTLPCLVIRGICDYADSHKQKQWQPYAAATAAACAKELLSVIPERELQSPSPPSPDCRKQILDSLCFKRIDSRHEEIETAQSRTCEWLLRDPRFLDWLDSSKLSQHHGFLWIKGKPGSGKSTLMKFLLGNAKKGAGQNAVVLAFFFNARGGHLEKSTTGMFRSLLSQLFERVPELQDVLDDLPPDLDGGNIQWDLGTVRKLFFRTIPKLGSRRLIFFIDALDECDDSQVRDMVIDFENLGNVAAQSAIQFYVCFSSRHYPHIRIETGMQLNLEDQAGHTEDIQKYVRKNLSIGTSQAARETKEDVIKKTGGIFLWAVLVLPILEKEFGNGRIDRVKTRLQELPPGLSGLFRDILRRDNDDLDSLLLSIQWILYARHPMRPEEFYYAVLSGLNPESEYLAEWDPEYTTADTIQKFVLGSSKGLAEMTRSDYPTVQFIHESVRDYLIKDNGLRELFPELEQDFESSCHNRLKQCCQTYMQVDISAYLHSTDTLPTASSKEAKDPRENVSNKFPFLKYAVHQIFYHADAAAIAYPQESFLQELDLSGWINLVNVFETFAVRRYTSSASLQYILAENNLSRLLSAALKIDPTTDVEGERYFFPLLAAAVNGNEDSAKVLVKEGANIKVKDKQERTALYLAAETGHLGMVQILLEGKADVNAQGGYYGNALQAALVKGYNEIVALLLDKGADVNAQGGYYGNALQAVSIKGHDKIAALLFEKGAEVNTQGGVYRNALNAASVNNYDKIVTLLIGRGADVNAQGGVYGNALNAALALGFDKIAVLLFEGGADVHVQGKYGSKLLSLAVGKGLEATARLLIKRGADVNAQCGFHGNALQIASIKGYDKMVTLLLERGAHVNAQGGFYGNALQAASVKGYDKIVTLLLDKGANVNAQGGYYGNALRAASIKGYDKIAELLLKRGADVNAQGGYYGNALQAASIKGHDKIAALLLKKGADVNAQGGYYGNALQAALIEGNDKIAALLLKRGADVNAQGGYYGNALQATLIGGYDNIATLLRKNAAI